MAMSAVEAEELLKSTIASYVAVAPLDNDVTAFGAMFEAAVIRTGPPARENVNYEAWRQKTDPLSRVNPGDQVDLEDYHTLIDLDPESILARDLKLDHIRRFAGSYGHSQYDHWARREEQ